MKKKVSELIHIINRIDEDIAIQRDLIDRVRGKEVMLDESYILGLTSTIEHLSNYRAYILNSEATILL